MRLVVTGALGHIGSRLVRFLPEAFPGCEVTMVDNLSTQRFGSLFDLPPTGRYRFVEADVTKVDLVPLLRGADAVVQLAAITDAAGSFDRAREVRHTGQKRQPPPDLRPVGARAEARFHPPLHVPHVRHLLIRQQQPDRAHERGHEPRPIAALEREFEEVNDENRHG